LTEKIAKYFDSILRFLEIHPFIKNVAIEKRVTTRNRGYIKGMVTFTNGNQLHIKEFINSKLRKISYAYHYQDKNGVLIFGYDNAPHHVEIKTFPHHKHVSNKPKPEPTQEKNIVEIVKEIVEMPSATGNQRPPLLH